MVIRKNVGPLLTVGLLMAWFLLLRPGFLGGPASYLVVAGPSMEPTFSSGDLAVVRKEDAYGAGDVVAFRVPGGEPGQEYVVIHRIIGGTAAEGFVTQGDNRPRPDMWNPAAKDVLGRVLIVVPYGGRLVLLLRQPLVLGMVAGLLGMLLVLTSGRGKPRAGVTASGGLAHSSSQPWK